MYLGLTGIGGIHPAPGNKQKLQNTILKDR